MNAMTEITVPVGKLAGALAKAQSEIASPPRNREVTVRTKTGGQYKFKYATLDSIIDAVRVPLTKNGLWFTQTLAGNGDGKYHLVTRLVHDSGESIESVTPLLVQGAGNQEFGSALTYMRRYALTAMLGVAADEDDDANGADGNTITESRDRPAISPGVCAPTNGDDPEAGDKRPGDMTVANLKTALAAAMADIEAIENDADLLSEQITRHWTAIEQCVRRKPMWWYFRDEPAKGMKARIAAVIASCESGTGTIVNKLAMLESANQGAR